MTIDEIDEQIAAKEAAMIQLRDELRRLHIDRTALVDEAGAKALLGSMTPGQRDAIARVRAVHFFGDVPDAS